MTTAKRIISYTKNPEHIEEAQAILNEIKNEEFAQKRLGKNNIAETKNKSGIINYLTAARSGRKSTRFT